MQLSSRDLFRGLIHKAFRVQDLELCEFAAEDETKLLGESRGCGLHAALDARKVAGIGAPAKLENSVYNVLKTPATLLARIS